jgi:hypothetical protein
MSKTTSNRTRDGAQREVLTVLTQGTRASWERHGQNGYREIEFAGTSQHLEIWTTEQASETKAQKRTHTCLDRERMVELHALLSALLVQ